MSIGSTSGISNYSRLDSMRKLEKLHKMASQNEAERSHKFPETLAISKQLHHRVDY